MLTVEDYAKIRLAHRDGMSVRAIAKDLHHSRRKIREVLKNPEPRPYTRKKPPVAPKLGPLTPIIRRRDSSSPAAYSVVIKAHGSPATLGGFRHMKGKNNERR